MSRSFETEKQVKRVSGNQEQVQQPGHHPNVSSSLFQESEEQLWSCLQILQMSRFLSSCILVAITDLLTRVVLGILPNKTKNIEIGSNYDDIDGEEGVASE